MAIWFSANSRALLTDSHSPMAMEQAPARSPARPVTRMAAAGKLGAGDTHHQAQVGDEPVIGAEHRRAQRIAAAGAMPALELGERAARQPARHRRLGGLDDARMRTLGSGQPGGHRFGLFVVLGNVAAFQLVDDGQDELWSEAACDPGEHPRAPADDAAGGSGAEAIEPAAPEQRMRLLDRGEAAIDLLELRLGLGLGERPIERGAVDLALEIAAIAADRVALAHRRPSRSGSARQCL